MATSTASEYNVIDSSTITDNQVVVNKLVPSVDPLTDRELKEESPHSKPSKGTAPTQMLWTPWTTHRIEVLRCKPGFQTFFVVHNTERMDGLSLSQIQQATWEYLDTSGDNSQETTKVFTADWPWERESVYKKHAGHDLNKANDPKANEAKVSSCFQTISFSSTVTIPELLKHIISLVHTKYNATWKKADPSRFVLFITDESLLTPTNLETLHSLVFQDLPTISQPAETNPFHTHLQIEFVVVGGQKVDLIRFHPLDHEIIPAIPEPELSYLPPPPTPGFEFNINVNPTSLLNTLSTKILGNSASPESKAGSEADGAGGVDRNLVRRDSLKIPTLTGLLRRKSVDASANPGERIKMDKL